MKDVRNNLAGGKLWLHDAVDCPGVSEIEESLARHRTYTVSTPITSL
jgi:hypothetical protein